MRVLYDQINNFSNMTVEMIAEVEVEPVFAQVAELISRRRSPIQLFIPDRMYRALVDEANLPAELESGWTHFAGIPFMVIPDEGMDFDAMVVFREESAPYNVGVYTGLYNRNQDHSVVMAALTLHQREIDVMKNTGQPLPRR